MFHVEQLPNREILHPRFDRDENLRLGSQFHVEHSPAYAAPRIFHVGPRL
jgi:hypothetical protein